MHPTLHAGRDGVVLTAPGKLRRGDILLFRRDSGEYLLHRVAKAEPGKLVMNGDSQAWTEAIRPEQVLAAVSHIRRKGKLISCRRWDYRLYTFLWQAMRPVRPLLFRGYSRMKRPKGTV